MPYGYPAYSPYGDTYGIPTRPGFIPDSGWSPSDIPQAEADALIAFYEATGGDSWTDNTGWGTDTTVGNWYGVTVAGGHVTVISLGDNNLTTTSASIDLTALQLTAAGVDAVLSDMVTSAGTGGTLDISGTNASPTGDGITDAETLVDDSSWTVTMSATEEEEVSDSAYLAYKDGEAMFFVDDEDFSDYADDAYLIRFVDGSDKVADAYAENVGGGETLGSELITNGDMESGSPPDSWSAYVGSPTLTAVADERTGGTGSQSLNTQRGSDSKVTRQDFSDVLSSVGQLIKLTGWVKNIDSTSGSFRLCGKYSSTVTGASWEQIITYATKRTTGAYQIGNMVQVFNTGSSGQHVRYDDISAKVITDIPATGLHLVSESGGSTRNLASIESGFDPNDIVTIQVWSV